MTARRQRMLGDANLREALGVEIGALHAPVLSRSDGRVIYVDYAATDVLRASLKHPGVRPEDVLPVDIVWGEVPLREAIGETVDIIVASHVMEHVPDLMGWLLELRAALRPGGILGLAIPDRRATFDAWRNDSTIASVAAAHLDKRRTPSDWQLFEAASQSNAAAPTATWRSEWNLPFPAPVLERLANVFQWLEQRPQAAPYQDAHCWVFTPQSFLVLAEGLAAMQRFPFIVEGFFPTEPGSIEFQVRLRAAGAGDPAIRSSIEQARETMPPVQNDPEALRAELDAVYTSNSWRLTRPLRAAARLLRAGNRQSR